MASIFRPTYSLPIPADAEHFTIKGECHARWVGKNGNKLSGPVTKNKKSILVESKTYYVRYRDQNGREKKIKGYEDKMATEALARKIQTRIDRIKIGLVEEEEIEAAESSVMELINLYIADLNRRDSSLNHQKIVKSSLRRVAKALAWHRINDIKIDAINRYLGSLRGDKKNGIGPSTYNHYIRILKAFSQWLYRSKRSSSHILRDLAVINEQTDTRIVRRSISQEELDKLIMMTQEAPRSGRHSREKLSSLQRAMLYRIASLTGFRASELASLTPESFNWEADPPYVQVESKKAKNRKLVPIPILNDLDFHCGHWIRSQKPGSPLFPGSWAKRRHAATMLRSDLKRAGIEFETKDGRFDFHALRAQFVTSLIQKNLNPAIVQRMARLSSLNLLTKHYTKLNLKSLKDAVDGSSS